MIIIYSDEIGIVVEEIDEYGISFTDGKAYFNDRVIDINAIRDIKIERIEK